MTTTIEIRTPTEEDMPATFAANARAFGHSYTSEEIVAQRTLMDFERFRIAVDTDDAGTGIYTGSTSTGKTVTDRAGAPGTGTGDVVGVIGSYALDVTLPGGATLPTGAVTWVSVAATHRRRGVARRLVEACHADIDARREPLAMLTSSEGGIYERFGYGMASRMQYIELDRGDAVMRPDCAPPPGAVRVVDGDRATAHVARTWERYRTLRPGEVRRSAEWHAVLFAEQARPQGSQTAAVHLAHDDGYAVYRVTADWSLGRPAHRLDLIEFVAVTPAAHAALWHTVLGVDLVRTITSRQLPLDDPLRYLLTDQRALRTVALRDGVWCRVNDIARCFGARTYATGDRLVVEVDGARYAIEGSPEGAEVRRVRSRPDLVTDQPSLSALLLGGVSPTMLVAGRRMTSRDADVLRRAELFFPWPIAPLSQTSY